MTWPSVGIPVSESTKTNAREEGADLVKTGSRSKQEVDICFARSCRICFGLKWVEGASVDLVLILMVGGGGNLKSVAGLIRHGYWGGGKGLTGR